MDLLMSLPPTSVANEAFFSHMKYVKTNRRGRLSQDHLNKALLIKLESASISDYNPEPAAETFMVHWTWVFNHTGIYIFNESLI